jgi:hypothetical protein
MKVRRDIASVPVRSAGETWQAIVDLITDTGSTDAHTLQAASSVIESLIADEHPAVVPIVVKGSGPRLAIYCHYNEDAMELGRDIDKLSWNPTTGDWCMTAPAEDGDVNWMNDTLKTRASRITVHDVETPPAENASEDDADQASLKIDWRVLDRS